MAPVVIGRLRSCLTPCSFLGFRIVFRQLSSEATQRSSAEKYWQVSSHGRCCDTRGQIKLGHLKADGYAQVNILGHFFRVHRLVAFAFFGPPPSKDAWQVHHRDGDRSSNHMKNLEYVTCSQNVRFSFLNPSRTGSGPAQSKPVMCRPIGCETWTTYSSVTQAAQTLQLSIGTVSKCCRDECPAKGLEFRFRKSADHNLEGEEWRPMLDPESGVEVPGRMVSSLGRIKSRSGVVHRGHLSKQGYYETKIIADPVAKGQLVHRLVAIAFLGFPRSERHIQVNHKDGNKGNNAVVNLEYVTASENAIHRSRMVQSNSERKGGMSPLAKPVWSREFGSTHEWTWHPSMTQAADALGVRLGNISACSRGLQRQTGGFEFHLADAEVVSKLIPGEEWRKVDLPLLLQEKWLRSS